MNPEESEPVGREDVSDVRPIPAPSPSSTPDQTAPGVGRLLRQSAVYGVAAALTATDAVKAMLEQARERVTETASAARESLEERAAQRKRKTLD